MYHQLFQMSSHCPRYASRTGHEQNDDFVDIRKAVPLIRNRIQIQGVDSI